MEQIKLDDVVWLIEDLGYVHKGNFIGESQFYENADNVIAVSTSEGEFETVFVMTNRAWSGTGVIRRGDGKVGLHRPKITEQESLEALREFIKMFDTI